MTELTVQNLVELFKFFSCGIQTNRHKFWKVTLGLTITLAITVCLFIFMFARPCRPDSLGWLAPEAGIGMALIVTIAVALSLVFIICGCYLAKLRSSAQRQSDKVEKIIDDLKMINEGFKSNEESKEIKMILGLIDDNELTSPVDPGMTIIPGMSISIGVLIIIVVVIKLIISCCVRYPMY